MPSAATHYFVFDTYPARHSRHFERNAAAIVGHWALGEAGDEHGLAAMLEQRLEEEGWVVAAVIRHELVTAEMYRDDPEGRARFDQVQLDGFVADVWRVPRAFLGGPPTAGVGDGFDRFVNAVAARGAVSFFSAERREWAHGQINGDDRYLPLWTQAADAREWHHEWDGYELRELDSVALTDEMLEELATNDTLLALGLEPTTLVSFHPWALQQALEEALQAGDR